MVFVGVMAAQGLLNNPAMYAGYKVTPQQCIKDWVSPYIESNVVFMTQSKNYGGTFLQK